MVVLVDLDGEDGDVSSARVSRVKPVHHSIAAAAPGDGHQEADDVARPNPNINGFSAALSCYPIARQLATQVDLNTLDSLSRTCRQFRANLLEYHHQLLQHSLHCAFENAAPGPAWPIGPRLTSGKVGKCARDMVSECQHCAKPVCRNCTSKSPTASGMRARHRRLCRTCTKAPLWYLTSSRHPGSASSSVTSPPASPDPCPAFNEEKTPRAFTATAFERGPCDCSNTVWLCQSCAYQLKQADTMYVRAWSWRTRYSHYLGGVGTGAGEGNEGVECGRGSRCLASKVVEHEIECDAETLASLEGDSPERWKGTSYHAQEIEGVGGGFKMKAKKYVRVGECVKVYEDERDKYIQFLEREVQGKLRSWCSWCDRVVLGEKDLAEAAGTSRPTSSIGSSSPSP